MKTELKSRTEIILMVNTFYDKVKADDQISHFFNEVIKVDWVTHLPKMYDFWETTIFHKAVYSGNPIKVHQNVNSLMRMKADHFKHWIKLFIETVNELFIGEYAEIAKQRAISIATVMQMKVMTN
ncbi:MAG: hemoglobin [Litorivivens sp.]|jgi:hemoglobin